MSNTHTHDATSDTSRPRVRPAWRIVLTFIGMVGMLAVGMLVTLVAVPLNLPPIPTQVIGTLGMATAAVLIVLLLQRKIERRPWSFTGAALHRRTVPHFLTGVLLAAGVMLAVKQVAVLLGFGQWHAVELDVMPLLLVTALQLLIITAGQAFPEELLWRGYLFGSLSRNWSPRATIIATSLGFGVLHIISNPAAEAGIGYRLLYALMAVSFGFALAACRVRTGTIWLAVGFHAGHNLTAGLTGMGYTPALWVSIALLTTFGTVMLALSRRRVAAVGKHPL